MQPRADTHCRDRVRMRGQGFETLPRLNVPYPNALVKLVGRYRRRYIYTQSARLHGKRHIRKWTYWSRHDEVGLRVEIAAEYVVTVALQGFQTFPLTNQSKKKKKKTPTNLSIPHPWFYHLISVRLLLCFVHALVTQVPSHHPTLVWLIVRAQLWSMQRDLQSWRPRSSEFCHQMLRPGGWNQMTRPRPRFPVGRRSSTRVSLF